MGWTTVEPPDRAAVNLYWLPLGAGGHCVRLNGVIFEAAAARLQHRAPLDLYHSALEVELGTARHVIETAPVWNERTVGRGVVSEGSVRTRFAGPRTRTGLHAGLAAAKRCTTPTPASRHRHS